jgi:hypothetical protein
LPSEEISKELALRPEFSYTAGDPRVSPDGRALGGVRKQTYWTQTFPCIDDSLEESLLELMRFLEKHSAFVARVAEGNGAVDVFVGWFESGNSGFEFSRDLINRLAAMRVGVAFDIYAQSK